MTLLVEIALVALAAIGIAVSVALLPEAAVPRRRRPIVRQPAPPDQLVRLQRLVNTAGANALHAHAYLRPLLAEIASRRLAARGQTLERMSEATGQGLLGYRLWELVRPGRPFPEDRYGPGVSSHDLAAMIEVLERL